jgi:hypothetical protein
METTAAKPTLIQTQFEESPINTTHAQPNQSPGLLVPLSLGLMATCAIAFFWVKEMSKKGGNATFLKNPQKIPCQNCYFFSRNSLLKCAVHPTTAMTSHAIDCSDFCDRHKKPYS